MKTRRKFIIDATVIMAGIAGLTACQDQSEQKSTSSKSASTDIDTKTLDAVVDAFVPRDQDAGAVEAGVSEKLLDMFDKKEDMRAYGVAMLDRVEAVAQQKYRRPFYRLGLAKREKIMQMTLHSQRKDDQPARQAISVLRGHVIEAFYLSPSGQTMLGFTPPYPNGYPDYHAPPVL
jgi:hypothetical protein